MVLLQLTTDTARIIIETQVDDFDAHDGHQALALPWPTSTTQ
jgi:hypothetical protein